MPQSIDDNTSTHHETLRRHDILVSGIASGLLGGLAMGFFLILSASMNGMKPLHPLDVIGATFAGSAVPESGASGSVALGAVLHLATSAAYGVVFAAIVPRTLPLGCAMVVGAGYAFFLLGIMTSCVVPAVNPLFRTEMQPIGGSWVIAQALYGSFLCLAPVLRRRLAPRPLDEHAAVPNMGATPTSVFPDQRAAIRR